MLDNVPKDALREWSSGQRAGVGPSSVVVKQGHEFGEVYFSFYFTIASQ